VRKPRMSNVLTLAAVAAFGLYLAYSQGWVYFGDTEGIRHLGAKEAAERLSQPPKPMLVDVRTPEEYRAGHLPDALLLPVDRLRELAPTALPDRNAPLLVYCATGNRSNTAVHELKRMGYTNLINMLGGITAWGRAGYPVVQ